ncbi:extracellular solute-binding protein [Lachnospiraceae bacterium ZAX-1]
MKKKIFSLLLSVALIASLLSGCGSKQSDNATDAGAEKSSAESESTTEETGDKQITITFAEHVADIEKQEPFLSLIMKAFEEKYPNIKVDITGREVSEHNTQMTLLAGQNKLPDIFWLEQATATEFAENGYLYNMTDELNNYGINDSLLPGLVNSCTVDGADYGLPSEVMMVGFFYNKSIFKQYGLEVPATYEEFMKVVKTLTDNGVTPLAIGSKSNFSVWAFESMLARYGFFEKLEGLKSGEESWVNDDFLNYFKKVEEMRKAGTFSSDVSTLDYFQAKEVFLAGKAAMFNTGAWDIADFEASDITDDIGFFWGPTFSDSSYEQKVAIKAAGGVYCVSGQAAEDPQVLDAVMKFWQFYYGKEGTAIIAEQTAGLPCANYNGEIDAKEHPVLSVMIKALNDDWKACREPFNSLSTNVAYGFFDATFGVICGVSTPEEAAQYVEDLQAAER